MKKAFSRRARLIRGLLPLLPVLFAIGARATDLDLVGVTLLRATTTNLDGSGVRVGQVEALFDLTNADWEVDPSDSRILLPVSRFTWYSTNVATNNFPNSIGTGSLHAGDVGGRFYGPPGGVSTNVAHIDNYEADYFFFDVVPSLMPISNRVVNQSFTAPTNYQTSSDTNYDNYADQYNTLFITAAGNGGPVLPPSTSYNGISVGAYFGATSMGPTLGRGRAKPDLTAPGDATSFSTPRVSGAAAILLQAGLRGDGGTDTNSAADIRTLKALLLNGAVKPNNWTNPAPSPLDPLFGAGVVNVFNSYNQLLGGKHSFIASTNIPTGNAHPPGGATGSVAALSGWDFNSITNTTNTDTINHYYFNVTNGVGASPFTGTMTLVWNRHYGHVAINNLDLYLYNATTGGLVAASISQVDNVEHIYVPQLPAGRYDLEVLKNGGTNVSAAETYALAFEFFAVQLSLARATNGGLEVTWPLYPSSFVLIYNPDLSTPSPWYGYWIPPVFTNNQNRVTINSPGGNFFFRLLRNP